MGQGVSNRISVSHGSQAAYSIVVDGVDRLVGEIERLELGASKSILVTDEQVAPLYADQVSDLITGAGLDVRVVVVPAGESTKSIDAYRHVIDEALDFNVSRRDPLVALGGGVVGDLAGFAAATTLRGIPLIHVPTSLVAQVDSSIGGKTGINHIRGKNLIGCFYQPMLVMTDPAFLSTLDDRNYAAGLAELVKHGLIDRGPLHAALNSQWSSILSRNIDVLHQVLPMGIRVKAQIVQRDPFERNERQFLNFGHTFAHAIELSAGYGRLLHGEAVAIGMKAALVLSAMIEPSFDSAPSLQAVGAIPIESGLGSISPDEVIAGMSHDKKRIGTAIRFVLLRSIGDPYVASVDVKDVRRALEAVE